MVRRRVRNVREREKEFSDLVQTYRTLLKKAQEEAPPETKPIIEIELKRSNKSLIADLSKDSKLPKTVTQYVKHPNRYDLLTLSELKNKQQNLNKKLNLLIKRLKVLGRNEHAQQIKKLRAEANRIYREYRHYRLLSELEPIVREEKFDEFLDLRFWNVLNSMYNRGEISHRPPRLPPNAINQIHDTHKRQYWIKQYDLYLDYLKENYNDIFDGVKDKVLIYETYLSQLDNMLSGVE